MKDFMVHCRWPDGDTEWFFSDDESMARSWAADARQENDCTAGVYGLLVVESPDSSVPVAYQGDVARLGRYAGRFVRNAVSL